MLKAKDIAEHFQKTSSAINQILADIGFIEKYQNGWKVTPEGKAHGGEEKTYKGNFYVVWNESILNNSILLKMLKPEEEIEDKKDKDFRKKFDAQYRTQSGHYVRSRAEVMIADWLYSNDVVFAYEKRVPIENDMFCDFYLPKYQIYIEYWGYDEDEKYQNRKAEKQHLYQEHHLNLIEIDNESINNIDDFLPKEILKFTNLK